MKARHVLFTGILMWICGGLLAEHGSAVSQRDIMMRLRGGAPEVTEKTKKPAAKYYNKRLSKVAKKGRASKSKASKKNQELTPKDFDNPVHWDRLLPDGPKPMYNLEKPILNQLRKTVMNMSRAAMGANSTEAQMGEWVNEVRHLSKF